MQSDLTIPAHADKTAAIAAVQHAIARLGFKLGPTDYAKPWGAYFYVAPEQVAAFAERYFPDLPDGSLQGSLQPKLLLVAPGKRLSWQYHHRRAELWNIVCGPVGVSTSQDDAEPEANPVDGGRLIRFEAGIRHRLGGLDTWGVVAEIWQHTDPARPSDEADIVRLADDFSRT